MFRLQENLILMKEMGNCPEFHRKEVTSYKIYTLECLLSVSFHLGYRQKPTNKTIGKQMR